MLAPSTITPEMSRSEGTRPTVQEPGQTEGLK
jgi:hypothetical protein